jgi:hypothetical protein
MAASPNDLDRASSRARPIGCSVQPGVLRRRRAALTATWSCVSYAIDALEVDLQVLGRRSDPVDRLQAMVDDLPEILAKGWKDGQWSRAVDIDGRGATVADTDPLFGLRREMVTSDLSDPDVARSLQVRMKVQRRELRQQRHRIEREIEQTQRVLLRQYAAETASADDWLAGPVVRSLIPQSPGHGRTEIRRQIKWWIASNNDSSLAQRR